MKVIAANHLRENTYR